MSFNYSVLQNEDISYLDPLLLDNKLLKVVPAATLSSIPPPHLTLFGHKKGFYCLPSIELANWLKEHFDLSTMIEIGAGHGALARYLNIPATDSRYQEKNKNVQLFYKFFGQPITEYPNDVIGMDYMDAIKHYKPKTVIGCWVTHKFDEKHPELEGNMFGFDEEWILKNVETYVVVGNENVHHKKPILAYPHETFHFPWLYSRSLNQDKNVIYSWSAKSLL
jgi:hypothetical protein